MFCAGKWRADGAFTRGTTSSHTRYIKLQNVQNHIQDVQREYEQIKLELHITSEKMKKWLSRCATIEHVKATIKLHDEEIMSFLGQLHKTLPRPRRIEVTKELLGFARGVHLILVD